MLKVTTFSSKGRVTRIYGHKTKRIHHLQSDIQLNTFLILEWIDSVIDIVENYELNDLIETLDNIEDLRLDKFWDKEKNELYKLHTNFLVTVNKDGKDEQVAISIKSVNELERRTVIEKMEIERRYWELKGVRFNVVTPIEIDEILVENIKWVREPLIDKSIRDKEILGKRLYDLLQIYKVEKIEDVFLKFENEEELREGTGLFIFRYLIATKKLFINMYKEIDLGLRVEEMLK